MESQNNKHISINIMEELVAEEVNRQMSRYPDNITQFINKIEVATFALNRLPPLYASSHKGLNKQKLKGKSDFSIQITQAVRKGFVAVQKDILRCSTPLQASDNSSNSELTSIEELKEAKYALAELAQYIPEDRVSWQTIVRIVKPFLIRRYQKITSGKTKNEINRITWH